jgi:hypothetical protein
MHILEQPKPCIHCGRDTTRAYSGRPLCRICYAPYLRQRVMAFERQPMEPRWGSIYRAARRLVTRCTRGVLERVLEAR